MDKEQVEKAIFHDMTKGGSVMENIQIFQVEVFVVDPWQDKPELYRFFPTVEAARDYGMNLRKGLHYELRCFYLRGEEQFA